MRNSIGAVTEQLLAICYALFYLLNKSCFEGIEITRHFIIVVKRIIEGEKNIENSMYW